MAVAGQASAGGAADARLRERDGLRWWPSLLGVAVAVGSGFGLAGTAGPAMIVAVAAFLYVAAAGQGSGRAAWLWFVLTFPVVAAGRLWGPLWAIGAFGLLAVVLMAWGVARGRWPVPGGLRRQSAAVVVFGAVAVVGCLLDPVGGGLLLAAGLAAHGVWDVVHHRWNRVVVRSYAEFCGVLDFLLAGFVVWAVLA